MFIRTAEVKLYATGITMRPKCMLFIGIVID